MKTYLIATLFLFGLVSIAQPPTTEYYTIQNGIWTNNIWSNVDCSGANCGCTPGCPLGSNSDIYVCHIVTASCTIDIGSNSSLTVRNGGDLSVTGGGSITGTGDFTVESGGSVTIDGDLDLSGNGDLTIDGDMTVNGNVNINSGGSSICGTGVLNVNGSLTGNPCGTLTTNVLPIDLLQFSGESRHNSIVVDWITATEINNNYFILYKSVDGVNYEPIATLDGAGNSSQTQYYSVIDNNPTNGANFYKLKQVDFNGAHKEYGPAIVFSDGHVPPVTINSHDNLGYVNTDLSNLNIHTIDGKQILVKKDLKAGSTFDIKQDFQHVGSIVILTAISKDGNQLISEKVFLK